MNKRLGTVSVEFAKQLEGLVNLLREEGIDLPGRLSTTVLAADAEAQHADGLRDRTLTAEARSFHIKFVQEQAARHARYTSAVQALRSLYRDEPPRLALIERFKRHTRRQAQPDAAPAVPANAADQTLPERQA